MRFDSYMALTTKCISYLAVLLTIILFKTRKKGTVRCKLLLSNIVVAHALDKRCAARDNPRNLSYIIVTAPGIGTLNLTWHGLFPRIWHLFRFVAA